MKFVDISHWNGDINFNQLKDAVDGVLMKVSQGDNYFDTMFERYYAQATAVGLKVGVYVYMVANNMEYAKREAAYALRHLSGKALPLGIWLDAEDDKIRRLSCFEAMCIEELATWKAAGYNVGIYCNLDWYRNTLTDALKLYPLWIARYGANTGQPIYASKPDIDMYMWQYTSKGKAAGISGTCDLNEVYKTFEDQGEDPEPAEPDETFRPHVKYKAYTKSTGWLPEVLDATDYAGIQGRPITAFAVMATEGKVKYRCHTKKGKWYPYVTGYSGNDFNNGYAGDLSTEIDAIEVLYMTPSGRPTKRAKYQVAPVNKSFYPPQYNDEKTNGQDGYAGSFRKSIDRIMISLVD